MIEIVRTIAELRTRVASWRREDARVGVVPTMGALHGGHLALVAASITECDRTVVTLFVNPTQFGQGEDLAHYPRDEADDAAKATAVGADLLFAPDTAEMYPPGFGTAVQIGGMTTELEGAQRPGHFDGVATVVAKLLLQSAADRAYFGEKDYQQLCVVRQLVRDLDIPCEIRGVETVREPDRLALSSRNAYLDAGQRAAAPALNRTLIEAADRIAGGAEYRAAEIWARDELLAAGFEAVDYVAARDAATLAAPTAGRPIRLLAAARMGATRLLDNVPVG